MNPRWPAAVLALLVGAGAVKSSTLLTALPVDLTLMAAVLIVIAAAHALVGTAARRGHPPAGWAAAAAAFWFLGMMPHPGGQYAAAKVIPLFALTLGCAFVGALLLVRHRRQRAALAWGTVGVGILVAALAELAPSTDHNLNGRLALAGDVTIAPARIIGAAVVVLVVLAISRRLRLLVAVPLIGALLVAMIATGSRGPLVALIAATAAALLFLPTGRGRALAVLAVVTAVAARLLTGANASARDRFMLLLADNKGDSVTDREHLWGRTWQVVADNPRGQGWGGLEPILSPVAAYPHDILLEVAGEGGWLALGALLAALTVAGWRLVRAARAGDPTALPIFALLVFWLTGALVSGDLNDNRGLFVTLAAGLATRATTSRPSPRAAGRRSARSVPV